MAAPVRQSPGTPLSQLIRHDSRIDGQISRLVTTKYSRPEVGSVQANSLLKPKVMVYGDDARTNWVAPSNGSPAGLVSPSMAAQTLKVMVYGAPFTRATEKQGPQ